MTAYWRSFFILLRNCCPCQNDMIKKRGDIVSAPYFNPYNFQQYQPSQFPQMQQYQPQPQPNEARITVAQVPTIEDVERVQMAPGERKIVFVQNNPDFLAIRVADNAGFVSTEYRMSHVIDPKRATPAYAPMQAVEELQKQIDELKEVMAGATATRSTTGTRKSSDS